MSINFSSIQIDILCRRCRPVYVTALLILSTLVAGCASLVSKGRLPEVVARRPPDIQLGAELILLEKPPIMITSLIDKEGVAHVFVVNKKKQLKHIGIFGDKIIIRELLGTIETKNGRFIDAVEQPFGKLRVLAGDKQYFQVASSQKWSNLVGY